MPSLPPITAKVIADPTGFQAGLDKAQAAAVRWGGVLSKLPGADIFQRYNKEITGMAAGFGAAMIASKAIDFGKGLVESGKEAVGLFREQAKEANKLGLTLGVTSKSLYEMQAVAKGASFDDLAKIIFRYNLAAGDANKASQFTALGLKRVSIEGGNAVEVFRDLARATEGMSQAQKADTLKRMFSLKPDQLMQFLPMLEGGAAGVDKRLRMAQEIGLVPTQESLDLARMGDRADKIAAMYALAKKRRIGEMLLPVSTEMSIDKAAIFGGLAKETELGTLGGTFGVRSLFGLLASREELKKPQTQALLAANVDAAAYRDVADKVLGPLRDRLDVAQMGASGAAMAKLRHELTAGGMDRQRVEMAVAEASALEHQVKAAEKLAAVRESTKFDRGGMLAIEVDQLKRADTAGAAEKLADLKRAFYDIQDPIAAYDAKLQDIITTHRVLGGTAEQLARVTRLEGEALASSLGTTMGPRDVFNRRIEQINKAGYRLTEAQRASAIQAAVAGLGSSETRLPSAVTYGSQQAAEADARWRMGLDRKPEMTQERMVQLLERANQLQAAQVQSGQQLVGTLQKIGIVN